MLYSTCCTATMREQCVDMKTDGMYSCTTNTGCIHTAPYSTNKNSTLLYPDPVIFWRGRGID